MPTTEVVVTGVGVVSPIGIGKQRFAEALYAGRSGIRPFTLFDAAGLTVRIGGRYRTSIPRPPDCPAKASK